MNTRIKGNKNRFKTVTILEEKGYLVAIVERTGRFVFPKDMFGLFDLVSIKKDVIKFIQVSSNRPHSHKEIKNFRKVVGNLVGLEQWIWYDKRKKVKENPKIFTY